MTISVQWNDNGDLIISCGDERLIVPKRPAEQAQSAGAPGVKIVFPKVGPPGPIEFPPVDPPGHTVVLDVVAAARGNYESVANIGEMKQAISQFRRRKRNKEKLYLEWNSKDAIPIWEINTMIEAGARDSFEIGVFPLDPKSSSK